MRRTMRGFPNVWSIAKSHGNKSEKQQTGAGWLGYLYWQTMPHAGGTTLFTIFFHHATE
jgi:hypothetical protein